MAKGKKRPLMFHLNVRIAWHDNKWDGTVCKAPSQNSYCVDLDRIRAERQDAVEDGMAGQNFADIKPDSLPPCVVEAGAFMNRSAWCRVFKHPYQGSAKTQETHGHLKPTLVKVPPYSAFAVPFLWMLRSNQDAIDESLPEPLPPDEEPPFKSAWVFGRERQEALCNLFFGRLTAKESLVFFYTKSGHPLGESISRLVVGVGQIESVGKLLSYDSEGPSTYPMWDRLITHSIRLDGSDGMLIPYHDYFQPTGDPEEDFRRQKLVSEIAVVPEASHIRTFSYMGELSTNDVALSTLFQCLESIRIIRKHGIAAGPWALREEWLNGQIHKAWKNRGAFPGAGAAVEALGMRLGTALILELAANGQIKPMDDPWPLIDAILRGHEAPPKKTYEADVKAVVGTWAGISEERRTLLMLMSRFSLSPEQARRWFDPKERAKATRTIVDDRSIIENPYRIVESDLGDGNERAVPLGMIDRGLMPDATVAAAHPVPEPTRVGSRLDVRRVRAGLVTVLRRAAEQGDSLLAEAEALHALAGLDLAQPCAVPSDWIEGNLGVLSPEVTRTKVMTDPEKGDLTNCVQLCDLKEREGKLSSILRKRAGVVLPSLKEEWSDLLTQSIKETGGIIHKDDDRQQRALVEKSSALEQLTTRRLSLLVGRAGTGKTTVLGALLLSSKLESEGILFLAPTGKARVRLTQKTNASAMTVAQFLYQQHRYDGIRQRPLFDGGKTYANQRTIVIDECSMLTMDDLYAVLAALDLGHVHRIILVGDPNQLPPIGVGRPFADFVAFLDEARLKGEQIGGALARLTVEMRSNTEAPSDTLRLASWFTREPQPVDADRVLSDIELRAEFNDLEICYWESPEELRHEIGQLLVKRLGLSDPNDIPGFNQALGLTKEGWVPFDDHDGVERFQILSPVRLHPHGVHDLNRWIQGTYRSKQLIEGRMPWGLALGEEEIIAGDKVILLKNGTRDGWDFKAKQKVETYLANGEIGLTATASGGAKGKLLNVGFSGRSGVRFGFGKWTFSSESAPLELAYALTVHKAQGSEFQIVFVVIPRRTRLLTRELLYTALTRSRRRLVLLIEGKDPGFLYELITRSETARRSTNLFAPGLRIVVPGEPGRIDEEVRYARYLVHRTTRGELVRSKSELAIAEHLNNMGVRYYYERPLRVPDSPECLRPDFSFIDDAGNVILWEHLGMLDREDYRMGWVWKRTWYAKNGFVEGKNLFTTSEERGLDMNRVAEVADRVREALA